MHMHAQVYRMVDIHTTCESGSLSYSKLVCGSLAPLTISISREIASAKSERWVRVRSCIRNHEKTR